jgi:hypothetical protein
MLDNTSDKPWLTDPLYGGMSERSAQLSWEANQKRKQQREQEK